MKKSVGAIYVLFSLFMFFLIPLVESLSKTICNSSAICLNSDNNYAQIEGVIWIPIITLLIGVCIIFSNELTKWFKLK